MRRIFILLLLFLSVGAAAFANNEKTNEEIQAEFSQWVVDFKKMANEKHRINKDLLDKAFEQVEYKPNVIKLDRNQPEFVKTFWGYYDDAVHPLRVRRGKAKLKEHEKILKAVEKKYKVPPEIIVAFWGMETDYGRNMGTSPLVEVLATLSFDHRRSKFFTGELVQVFKILQSGKVNLEDMKGSWAGAFGNFQFIPSTYASYAVDGDGDGKIDIRNSVPDALYSAANYLSKMGWDGNYRWGRPVRFDKKDKNIWKHVNSKEWYDISFFSKLGVTRTNGSKLPRTKIKGTLIAPMGVDGPVFLIYKNFTYIMRWNNSTNYALSVGLLSDALTDNKIGVIDEKQAANIKKKEDEKRAAEAKNAKKQPQKNGAANGNGAKKQGQVKGDGAKKQGQANKNAGGKSNGQANKSGTVKKQSTGGQANKSAGTKKQSTGKNSNVKKEAPKGQAAKNDGAKSQSVKGGISKEQTAESGGAKKEVSSEQAAKSSGANSSSAKEQRAKSGDTKSKGAKNETPKGQSVGEAKTKNETKAEPTPIKNANS